MEKKDKEKKKETKNDPFAAFLQTKTKLMELEAKRLELDLRSKELHLREMERRAAAGGEDDA